MDTDDLTPSGRPKRKRKTPREPRVTRDNPYEPGRLDDIERIAAVFNYFKGGLTACEIVAAVERDFPSTKLSREDPLALLRKAATRGWLAFHPPGEHRLEVALRKSYSWLQDVQVVHSPMGGDVAYTGALSLLRLVKNLHIRQEKNEVHVGFSGGHAMRALALAFADVLCEPAEDLPETIVFHPMVAGFDPTDPTTDPNSFCVYFFDNPLMQVRPKFVGFRAPSLVKPADIETLRDLPDIRAAFAAVPDIDIIVASGASWLDQHSSLRSLMQRSQPCMSVLEEEGCVADVLWRPISERGPIERATEIRALTLVELSDLPKLIRQGKHVLFTLAPCGLCNSPKGRLLSCLLNMKQHLMTELVVDSRTAAEMMRRKPSSTDH